MNEREALKLALDVFGGNDWHEEIVDSAWADKANTAITAIREALVEESSGTEQPAQQQKEGFASPGGGYVPAIPRPIPLDWKLVPRKATPEMLRAMDECAQEGYDERLYEGMASSVYMAAWDASPVLGTLPTSKEEMSMMDMIVGNLVREGINKHRARELAEHFIKQCNYTNGYCTGRTDLLAEQKAQQEPVGHGGRPMTLRECMEAEEPASKQEPVAWLHTKIEGVAVPHRPADLDKHPDRWEALYKTPPPCPTCEALARTVMLDQTYHDAQRKPLTDDEFISMVDSAGIVIDPSLAFEIKEMVEAAHGIKE